MSSYTKYKYNIRTQVTEHRKNEKNILKTAVIKKNKNKNKKAKK